MSAKKKKYIQDYKLSRGCAKCGFKEHFVALQLDHTDPAAGKNTKLSPGRRGRGWEKLKWSELEEELTKCQVLCANCHAMKTHKEKDHLYKH